MKLPTRATASAALVFLAMMAACDGGHGVGQACASGGDCGPPLTCVPDLPGGYCTADCSVQACGGGQTCAAIGSASLCLKNCGSSSDCRAEYQCFNAVCVPRCTTDGECGVGFMCTGGQCMPYPGAPLGAGCAADSECSSRVCLLGKCAQSCTHDAQCPMGETCALNPIGDAGQLIPTTHMVPACTLRRRTGAPGATCAMDTDCDRGSCQLGLCVELCSTTPDCHGGSTTCTKTPIAFDTGPPAQYQGCLPTSATLVYSADSGSVLVPQTAQAFELYVHPPQFDFGNLVGVGMLTDPSGASVYAPPASVAAFYLLKVRYQPSPSTSTMLVPNSPAVTLGVGVYGVQTFSSKFSLTPTSVYLKVAPAPIASGTVALNFYITDLSQACRAVTVANAPTLLAAGVDNVKQIYGQVNVTISDVTWNATSAPNSVRIQTAPMGMELPDLDNVLTQATAGQPTQVGLDVVLVQSILDPNGAGTNVLGVAGGIPTSPVLGTPHTGVVVAINSFCAGGAAIFATTVAHEVGHSLGLFHNVEQDGHTDPLTDTGGSSADQNLMYWLEGSRGSSQHLSIEQGQVIRNDAKVK